MWRGGWWVSVNTPGWESILRKVRVGPQLREGAILSSSGFLSEPWESDGSDSLNKEVFLGFSHLLCHLSSGSVAPKGGGEWLC